MIFSTLPLLPLPKRFTQSLMVLVTTLAITQSVLAESLEGYCISKVEPKAGKKSQAALLEEEPPPSVTVSRNDETFTIVVADTNPRELLLKREGETEAIDQIMLPPDEGKIVNLILGKDNWLWIDRNGPDYMMEVSFTGGAANFNSPKQLPELYSQPCHAIKRFFNRCEGKINSYYSATLSRAFVSGYRRKSWGKKNYIHMEVISGEEQPVPELLAKTNFVADIPQWNGVLFQNPSGEALFYDGFTVTDLSEDFLNLEGGENFQDWDIQPTLGTRTFIGKSFNRYEDDPLFLMELKAEPGFKPIYLPQQLNKRQWFKLLMMPDDSQSTVWIITRKKILAAIGQGIKTVIALPPSSKPMDIFIDGAKSIEQFADGQILFEVYNYTLKSSQSYLLRQASPTVNCEMRLDSDRSISLDIEQ